MKARELAVDGAYEFTPEVFSDLRGSFCSPYQETAFFEAVGFRLFPVAQASHSTSRAGVVRGIHYTAVPPGMGKYVYCSRGRALDFVVDVRVGSPTYGSWESVELHEEAFRALYCPLGVGHLFVALTDDTVMTYMLSEGYVAENERAVSPFDSELGLDLPADLELVLSERDRRADTLAEAKAAGLLPKYTRCREIEVARGGGDVGP